MRTGRTATVVIPVKINATPVIPHRMKARANRPARTPTLGTRPVVRVDSVPVGAVVASAVVCPAAPAVAVARVDPEVAAVNRRRPEVHRRG